MALCKFCGDEVPQKELFKHFNEEHPDEMREMRSKGGKAKAGKTKGDGDLQHKQKVKTTSSLVEAAMLEFVGQTIVVPNTPALIYGYFCAKKYGFEGSVGEFLTEVIDDFYQARDMNYYEEVSGWQEIGKATLEKEQQEPKPVLASP